MKNKKIELFYPQFKHVEQQDWNKIFSRACFDGNMDAVKYFLTSPDVKEHIDIHYDNDDGLFHACNTGKFEVIKYLLTSPELKEHANIHADNDWIFSAIYAKKRTDVIRFLVFDMNIEKTKEIQRQLDYAPDVEVINMFKIRELNQQLEQSLSTDRARKKTPKL